VARKKLAAIFQRTGTGGSAVAVTMLMLAQGELWRCYKKTRGRLGD
jgi:hypothetical protein